MQLYAVKLDDEPKRKLSADQIINGYLGYKFGKRKHIAVYTLGSARQKASFFGGKSEKIGKEYTIDIKKTILICILELEQQVRDLLQVNDERVSEADFVVQHINSILQCTTLKVPLTKESKIELICLFDIILPYDYVSFKAQI